LPPVSAAAFTVTGESEAIDQAMETSDDNRQHH
jgi:hypothetical protein